MLEKIKKENSIDDRDKQEPQTIQDLIRRYDLGNKKIEDFLDYLIDYLNGKGIWNGKKYWL